ncbi:F0F1 ATP synthase subunit epsilon [Nioella nitratireducens]|uniref:F0F1 ATP synthase subunit epsilon n=1 Tax=Nioella nitratireducens TaxID=1287720 RepID=UPI0008FD077B|nr:F0F1 ATP synthase subunit epsilon [Nioella nitratireducens]
MSGRLHLTISTPMEVVVDAPATTAVRAEDESGGFGILPGHTDFLTVLPASVLRWRDGEGLRRFCAIRQGLLTVTDGARVAVACRQAILGQDLEALQTTIRDLRRQDAEAERQARVEQMRLHAQAVRQMMRLLRPDRPGMLNHPPAISSGPQGGADG